jgi:hypothetical protein
MTQLSDSGARQTFSTGSLRDPAVGKGRFDLISPIFLKRLAQHHELGARKYPENDGRNWELGQPLSRYLDSALRHLTAVLNKEIDEDHAIAAAWNIAAFIHTAEKILEGDLPLELDNIGWIKAVTNNEASNDNE